MRSTTICLRKDLILVHIHLLARLLFLHQIHEQNRHFRIAQSTDGILCYCRSRFTKHHFSHLLDNWYCRILIMLYQQVVFD